MKRLKILLVQTALSDSGPSGPSGLSAPVEAGRLAWLCEPVALTSLAAVASDHDVRILDLRIDGTSALGPALRTFRPDLVAIAPASDELHDARTALRVARSLLGSACLTALALPEADLAAAADQSIDLHLLGDPEPIFHDVLAHLAGGGHPDQLGTLAGVHATALGGSPLDTQIRKATSLDRALPPARHLLAAYRPHYFFAVAQPAAAMRASRAAPDGRSVQRMSADTICDRLEIIPESFVLFLDDDFFADPLRLARLAEAMLRRDVRKYWAVQASPERVAENPHLVLSLRDAGLAAVILTFDLGESDGLEMLLDPAIAARNRRAAGILRALGVAAMGLFTVRRDLTDDERTRLSEHIRELGIAWSVTRAAPRRPAVPSPAPLPTALVIDAPGTSGALGAAWEHAAWELLRRRPRLLMKTLPGVARALGRSFRGRAGISSAAWAPS
ncbi:hypothetical protein [Chondromyces apiculatus]|nr:hypothetical protein [Chondromyces apiculatus]